MSGAELARGAEGAEMDRVGKIVWEAMEKIVDASPVYTGVSKQERLACIGRLAAQALMAGAHAPCEGALTYVILTSVGRLVGQILAQAPSPASAQRALTLLSQEIQIGADDYRVVTEPRGHA